MPKSLNGQKIKVFKTGNEEYAERKFREKKIKRTVKIEKFNK